MEELTQNAGSNHFVPQTWIQVSDFEAPVVGLRCCAAPPHPILGTLKRGGGDGSSQRWVIEKKTDFCVNLDDVSLYHRLALYDFDGFSTTWM
jgi:hypothetical protein